MWIHFPPYLWKWWLKICTDIQCQRKCRKTSKPPFLLNCSIMCLSALQAPHWAKVQSSQEAWKNAKRVDSLLKTMQAFSSFRRHPELYNNRKLFSWYAKQHGQFHVPMVTVPLFCKNVMINHAFDNKGQKHWCSLNMCQRMCVFKCFFGLFWISSVQSLHYFCTSFTC